VSHAEIANPTGLVLEPLLLADEQGRPLVAPLIQGTWHLADDDRLIWLDKQPAIPLGGQWWGDPAKTSLRLEPQVAYCKPVGTDVVLLGHAHAARPGATEGQVGLKVGPISKLARVVGARRLVRGLSGLSITPAEPFERIAIRYEHAFGGWDRRDPDAQRHSCDARNPVGVGHLDPRLPLQEEWPLPLFEDPQRPYAAPGDTPEPVGFGFVGPEWVPRRDLAGTYDDAWSRTRKPLLARDFDRRWYQAASPGLVSPGHLRGDETAVVIGATPQGRNAFVLPARGRPRCTVHVRGRPPQELTPLLDTVIIDMDLRSVTLQWRTHAALPSGPHDLRAIELGVVRGVGEA